MSEVKRYYIGAYSGEAEARTCSPNKLEIIHQDEGRYFVLDEDFDRVTAERDAVRETLENSYTAEDHERLVAKGQELNVKYIEKLEQRLTAAGERDDQRKELLRSLDEAWNEHDGRELFGRLMRQVEEELKPSSELAAQHAAIDFFDAALKPSKGCGDA